MIYKFANFMAAIVFKGLYFENIEEPVILVLRVLNKYVCLAQKNYEMGEGGVIYKCTQKLPIFVTTQTGRRRETTKIYTCREFYVFYFA